MDILKRSRRKKRGVILITVLLLLTIIIMIVTLLMTSAMSSVKLASSYSDGEQAYYAAMSGMEYVRNRVYYVSSWMQDQKSTYKPQVFEYYDSASDLRAQIHEDPTSGTIIGYLGGDERNYKAKFEIAFLDFSQSTVVTVPVSETVNKFERVFNEDYLAKTVDATIPKNLNYLSCNNFFNTSSSSVYKRNVTDKSTFDRYMTAPPNSMYLIVKGESNRTVKVVQSVLTQGSPKNVDTSSVARGSINVGVGKDGRFHVDTETDSGQPVKAALRAYGQKGEALLDNMGISVDGPVNSSQPFVAVGSNAQKGTLYAPQIKINDNILNSASSGPTSPDSYGLKIDTSASGRSETEALLEGGKNIDWQYIDQEVANNTGAGGEIPSGAYVYIHNIHNSTGEWKYFSDISISPDGSSFYINNPATSERPATLSVPDVYNFKNGGTAQDPKLTIEGVTRCNGPLVLAVVDNQLPLAKKEKILVNGVETEVERIKVVTPIDIPNSKVSKFRRVEVSFVKNSPPLVVKDGDPDTPAEFLLCGKLTGQGKVYSQGNIYFEGGSFFDTQAYSGVSVYAEKNVNIIPSDGMVADAITNAVIAAWGKKGDPNAFCCNDFNNIEQAAAKLLNEKVDGVTLRNKIKQLSPAVQEKDLKSFAKSLILQNCMLSVIEDGGTTHQTNAMTLAAVPEVYNSSLTMTREGAVSNYDDIYNSVRSLKWINNAVNADGSSGNGKVSITVTQNSVPFFVVERNTTAGSSQEHIFKLINDSKLYYKIWVHQETAFSYNPNDIYIYIPSDLSSQAYIMAGNDKNFMSSYNLKYNDGIYQGASYGKFMSLSIDLKNPSLATSILDLYGIDIGNPSTKNIGIDWEKFFNALDDNNNTIAKGYDCSGHNSKYTISDVISGNPDFLDEICQSILSLFQKTGGGYDKMNVRLDANTNEPSFFRGEISPDGTSASAVVLKDLDVNTISKNTLVKGMFFTRNGSFNANDFSNALTIKGGIVAYGGNINVNASTFNLNYAPEYMQFFAVKGVNTFYAYRAVFDDYNK